MKLKLVALTLIAFACWLVPIKVLAQETGTPKQIEVINPPANEPVNEKPNTLDAPVHLETNNSGKLAIRQNKSLPTASYNGRHYSKEEVQQLVKDYSAQYGINPEVPLCIAFYESGYNQYSKNKRSSASGVFQYLLSTWKATDEGKAGMSVFDADSNVKAAIKYMASRRNAKPWVVAPKCPSLL